MLLGSIPIESAISSWEISCQWCKNLYYLGTSSRKIVEEDSTRGDTSSKYGSYSEVRRINLLHFIAFSRLSVRSSGFTIWSSSRRRLRIQATRSSNVTIFSCTTTHRRERRHSNHQAHWWSKRRNLNTSAGCSKHSTSPAWIMRITPNGWCQTRVALNLKSLNFQRNSLKDIEFEF